jgi:KaiC/GvpD/RAD55 family RecA-like ATPase
MRMKTGIEGLDKLIKGGFLSGRQYLVSGSPGVYVVLSESVETIIEDMSRYNLHILEIIERKRLFFLLMLLIASTIGNL